MPAEELAGTIGVLLGESGLSAGAKVEQIKEFAAQRQIPIHAPPDGTPTHHAYAHAHVPPELRVRVRLRVRLRVPLAL